MFAIAIVYFVIAFLVSIAVTIAAYDPHDTNLSNPLVVTAGGLFAGLVWPITLSGLVFWAYSHLFAAVLVRIKGG